MSSSAAGTSPSPARSRRRQDVSLDKNISVSSEIFVPHSELPTEIHGLFSSIKRKSQSQRHEMKQKHAEELHTLSKKYHQVKEQLRVQQELMENRENADKFLQDQLNKATIELAQLRLIKDDLNSSLKQATAQIQYITREKEKLLAAQEQGDRERQVGMVQLQEQLMEAQQQIEKLKADSGIAMEKMKADRSELKSQLSIARKVISELQDENFKTHNETRAVQAQYESEKTEFIKAQQKFAELQMKHAQLTEGSARMREENEKMKESLARSKLEMVELKGELKRADEAKTILTSQNKLLSDELKEKNALLSKSEMDAQRTHAKLDATVDNLKQNQKMLDRMKQNFTVENEGLRQAIVKEKAATEKIREENQRMTDELNHSVRELKLEKSLREKTQAAESQLRQRLAQAEQVMAELENERVSLTQQIQDSNEEIEAKNELIEENDKKLSQALSESHVLREQLKEAQNTIHQLSSQIGGRSIADLEKEVADLRAANQTLSEQLKQHQNQLRDLNISYERVVSEKQNDLQTIEDLNETLKKERENIKAAAQERKEARRKTKVIVSALSDLKNKLSTSEAALSLAHAENSHLADLVRAREAQLAELSQEKAELLVTYNQCSEDLRDERTAHTVLASENESLRTENSKVRRKLDELKMQEKALKERVKIADQQNLELKQKVSDCDRLCESLRSEVENLKDTYQQAMGQLLEERDQKEKAIIKCNSLTANSQTAHASIKSLDSQLLQTKARLSEKGKALTAAQLQLEQLKDINDHLNQENEALTNERMRLITKLQDTEKQLNSELQAKEDLRMKITNEIQNTLDQLKTEKNAMAEQVAISDSKLKEAEEHIFELQEVINALQEDVKVGQRKTNDAENKVYDVQRQLAELETARVALHLQTQEQLQMLAQLREEKKELKDQVEGLEHKNVMDRVQHESIAKSNLEALRSKLMSEQNALIEADQQQKERIKRLEQESGKLLKENRKIKRQTAILVTKYQSLSERASSLADQKDELIKENQELRASLVEQAQSLGQLDRQNKKLDRERTKLFERIHSLSIENEQLEGEQSELFSSKARLTQTQSDVKQMEIRLATITDLNKNLRNQVAAAKVAQEQSAHDFGEITKTASDIRGLLKPEDGVPNDTMNTMSGLLESLVSSRNDIESLIQQRDLLISEVSDLKRATSRLLKAQRDGKNDLMQALGKHEIAEHELHILRGKQQMDGMSGGVEELQTALQMSNTTVKALEDENSRLRDERTKLKQLLEHVRDIHSLAITIPD